MYEQAREFVQAFLCEHIPLAKAMQLSVRHYDGQHLSLAAPLVANHNDKQTAFAGSISSLATVTAWALLMLWARQQGRYDYQVAVVHADIHYKKPVLTDFYAQATLPTADVLVKSAQVLAQKGRVRIAVQIDVMDEHGIAAKQLAEYAVWRVKI
ncbi:thioesterase domain-containing protein [Agitococcus lubricus]|uniref:Thioesterase domain-containing protein n=2 Tax=Agitococcus lubricus TaxID=1077255 RepID=A0A2T5IWX1_9GAMM|nr:thioesterase domain-containing protein [Agitococcus lubricus]